MTMAEKVRENKARRAAKRQGYSLRKPRARYTYPLNIGDYGGYALVESQSDVIAYGEKFRLSLEEVEKILRVSI